MTSSLFQSKQQNENNSGIDEWFCQSEDPWQIFHNDINSHMTDPWNSETGTDIWKMADCSDPFFVDNNYDNASTSLICDSKFENDALLISSTGNQNPIPATNLLEQFSDSDSDSCSDYELHSIDVDNDSDEEDVLQDSGAVRFQFVDPVAEMLDSVVQSGVLPKEHIFYKLVSSVLEYVSYNHTRGEKYQWDPTIVRWARSLLRLGKSRTYNFLRGPGGFNTPKEVKRQLKKRMDFGRFGIPLPSKRTLRRNKPGYTTASGIIKNLLISVLKIAHVQNANWCVNNSDVKAIAISLTRDGLGLKPSLEFDERKKTLVGSTKTIDTDYIKKNPIPNPSELKKNMIKDADISVVTTYRQKDQPSCRCELRSHRSNWRRSASRT